MYFSVPVFVNVQLLSYNSVLVCACGFSQIPAAASEEGRAILPYEADGGGHPLQWENLSDPAAHETQTLSVEVPSTDSGHQRQRLDHQKQR